MFSNHGDYLICSWLVAYVFTSQGYSFGVDPGGAQPDDIWDFCSETECRYYEMDKFELSKFKHISNYW